MIRPSTFSIAACDPQQNAWGVAVASKFLAAGAIVPWAEAGAGAVATQSFANSQYGPQALAWMRAGIPAEEALQRLINEDSGRDLRQVGLIDAQGGSAAYTGAGCFPWAGHICGQNFTCQGNILAGADTVKAMAESFSAGSLAAGSDAGEHLPLAGRLLAALAAGEAAGGDSRGRQSAALLVVTPGGGYAGFNDRAVDLRVDDDPAPVQRLGELLAMHALYFGRSPVADRLPIQGDVLAELHALLRAQGLLPPGGLPEPGEPFQAALARFIGRENLEDRCDPVAGWIDPPALEFIRRQFGSRHPGGG